MRNHRNFYFLADAVFEFLAGLRWQLQMPIFCYCRATSQVEHELIISVLLWYLELRMSEFWQRCGFVAVNQILVAAVAREAIGVSRLMVTSRITSTRSSGVI